MPTTGEASAYFATRLGAGVWTTASEATQASALATAERDLGLYYSLDQSNPKHLTAIFEQALFRLTDPAIDRRAALQAQGVASAGVVSETYTGAERVPVCAYARQILGHPGFGSGGGVITRNDAEA